MNQSSSPCRALFLGQKPVGQRAFRRLLAKKTGIVLGGAVSNISCDNWWRDNDIYEICAKYHIPFLDNTRRNNEAIRCMIDEHSINCVISVQHSWILPTFVIDAVQGRAFNLHLAPLPGFKGWHGVNHAILQGLVTFGVSLHWLTADVDSGNMAYSASFPVQPDDTAMSLYSRCEEAGLQLFDCLLDDLAAGNKPPSLPLQGEHRYFDAAMLDGHREVTSLENLEEVDRRVRALYFPPFEPAHVKVAGRRIFLVPTFHGA